MVCSIPVDEDDELFLHSFIILVRFNKFTTDGLLIDPTANVNKMAGRTFGEHSIPSFLEMEIIQK